MTIICDICNKEVEHGFKCTKCQKTFCVGCLKRNEEGYAVPCCPACGNVGDDESILPLNNCDICSMRFSSCHNFERAFDIVFEDTKEDILNDIENYFNVIGQGKKLSNEEKEKFLGEIKEKIKDGVIKWMANESNYDRMDFENHIIDSAAQAMSHLKK